MPVFAMSWMACSLIIGLRSCDWLLAGACLSAPPSGLSINWSVGCKLEVRLIDLRSQPRAEAQMKRTRRKSNDMRIRALIVTPSYPAPDNPEAAIFVHRQVTNLMRQGVQCSVLQYRPEPPRFPIWLVRRS